MSVRVKIYEQEFTYSVEDGWRGGDPVLRKTLSSLTETLPFEYYPDIENAIAEYIARRLGGKVLELNEPRHVAGRTY